jgi:pentatricopeptide repeat domain-containing protein 1
VDEAMRLLDRMIENGLAPDSISYSSVITACANARPAARVDEAMVVLDRMVANGVSPNTITFNSLITACANAKPTARLDDAVRLLERMLESGLVPNEYTLPALLKCCRNDSDRAENLFTRLIGPVRLSKHVKKQLWLAMSPHQADRLCKWAATERPECLLPVRSVR